ncbi:MAG: alpha/beta family hydrolase [Acidobacteriota bacterium]
MDSLDLQFEATRSSGNVSALLLRPASACCLLVFGHGAGAGMKHAFMEAMSARLAARDVATFRYQFPYMEQGRRRPDYQNILLETARSAVSAATAAAPDLPLLAGGKSMGGRMTSMAAAKEEFAGVRGLAFFGFPLHPIGKPGTDRGDHLDDVTVPMLFLQGTRDKLADLELLKPVVARQGARATLHVVEGADHGFHVLKRSGRTDDEVQDEVADAMASWARQVLAAG